MLRLPWLGCDFASDHRDIWDTVELVMECVVIDLLLKDPPYPFGIREAPPHGADWWFARACGLALEGSKAGRH